MEFIVLTQRRRLQRALHFGTPTLVLLSIVMLGLVGASFWLGQQVSGVARTVDPRPDLYAAAMREDLQHQRSQVNEALGSARRDLDALALQLSELQARSIRIDALGLRLAEVAGLDIEEFSFGESPARGGVEPSGLYAPNQVVDFVGALRDLELKLESRTQELEALETSLLSGRLAESTQPAGVPLFSGWISSVFGPRNDPLNGVRSFHYGVDFAGKRGSPITSVAAGIVAFAGERTGLGKVVEVDHGNGYRTRYAHNLKNLVAAGQRVAKGESVARVGSSGRSTGNHVHFEVLKNGKQINPMDFIKAK